MHRSLRIVSFVALCLIGAAKPALAIPTLQLDIKGGVYDPVTQTIVATGSPFTLYALLIPNGSTTFLTDTYYISAALVPKTKPPGGTYGTFSFDGTSYRVTEDMVYGRPPIEDAELAESDIAEADKGDIQPAGIYDTYFREFSFSFNAANRATAYDSKYASGSGPTANPGGSMYFQAFDVDTSNIQTGYAIHFSLYKVKVLANGDKDIAAFAPWSHDALGPGGAPAPIPEPGSLALLATGIAAAAAARRRRRRR